MRDMTHDASFKFHTVDDGEYRVLLDRAYQSTELSYLYFLDAEGQAVVPQSGEARFQVSVDGLTWVDADGGAFQADAPYRFPPFHIGLCVIGRIMLSGVVGASAMVGSIRQSSGPTQALVDMLTSEERGFRRLRVDVGQTQFWMGRQFGVSYEFSLTTRLVLKFSTPVDAILNSATITVDEGALRYRVFGFPNDSRETSPFTNPIPIHPLNLMSITPAYAGQVEAFDDGDFDESGLNPFPTARIRTANASGHKATQAVDPGAGRGFGPGNAYIVMTNLEGTGTVTGVVDFRFEERDQGV